MHGSLWRVRALFRDLSRSRRLPRLPSSGLWRQSDFLKLWLALTVSSLGSEVTTLALPLTAVLLLGAGPAQMGLLEALEPVPFLLIGLVAGAWVDRVRRRPVLILADLGRAFLLGSIPVAALLGVLRMEHLYAVAFLVGVLTVLDDLAGTAFVPTVVARANLVEANSKETVTTSGAGILGPGIAGWLVQTVSAPLAILVDSLSFLISAGCLGMIRTVEPVPRPAERRSRPRPSVSSNPCARSASCSERSSSPPSPDAWALARRLRPERF